jgi:hypothetical protein
MARRYLTWPRLISIGPLPACGKPDNSKNFLAVCWHGR